MAEPKRKEKTEEKPARPIKRGHHPENEKASGMPSGGGSRQGNIGHESNQTSDNAHR